MFHSPTRADCRTYCKIMAVALAGSIGTLMLWTSLIVSITKWDVEIEARHRLRTPTDQSSRPASGDIPRRNGHSIVSGLPRKRHNKATRQ
jgi:hypothetical protein